MSALKLAEYTLRQFLDVDGDGSGNFNANGNYSVTPEIFYIQPPAGRTYVLHRLLVHVVDSGTFDSGSYGNGITLSNGVVIRVSDDEGVLHTLTAQDPIITNTDWEAHCYDAQPSAYGLGNESLSARWTFTRDGAPIVLRGSKNERLEVYLSDDFSGLVKHTFKVAGIIT